MSAAGMMAGKAAEGSMQPAGQPTGKQPGKERPKRSAQEWRPAPLLCKRLNVPDPFKGRPQELTMSRFRTDYLALPDTELQSASASASAPLPLPPPPGYPPHQQPVPSSQASVGGSANLPGAYPPGMQHGAAQVGTAVGKSAAEAPTQEVQDARALADSFLASLGLHASGGEPLPAAAAAAGTAPAVAATAATAAKVPGVPTADQQAQAAAKSSRIPDPPEEDPPDVVTAAALERRAALHRSIFGGDADSESDEDEDEDDAAPAPSAPAQPQIPQPPVGSDAAGMSKPEDRRSPGSRVGFDRSAAQTAASAAAAQLPHAVEASEKSLPRVDALLGSQQSQMESVLGLPTGMQSRPVFMSKKARAAQASQSMPVPSSHTALDTPRAQPSSQPHSSKQSSKSQSSCILPGQAADIVRPPGVPAGALPAPAGPAHGPHPVHVPAHPGSESDDASSSSEHADDVDERTGTGRTQAGLQFGQNDRAEMQDVNASAGHSDAQGGAMIEGGVGPPPGMSAIQWQREQDARLREKGSRLHEPSKVKRHSKSKEKGKDKTRKHKHKKHKHKSRK